LTQINQLRAVPADKVGMGKIQDEILTERHLAVFGAILQCFARYELTIERAIAGLLRTEASNVVILTRHLDFTGKRLALLELLRKLSIPGDRWEQIFAQLSVPNSHLDLRNHIAHSTWKASPRPNSIQPDWILRWSPHIEPALETPARNDVSYTLEALVETLTNLAVGHERFVACLTELGLLPSEN
jgi:hypothetical protein